MILDKIRIIFENKNFLIIDKPSGLLVHSISSKARGNEKTLVDWLINKYPNIKDVGENIIRPGIVHRLDRNTSGIMIIAKNNEAFFYFKKLFQERKISKKYLALVWGLLKEKRGIIDKPIGRIRAATKRSVLAKNISNIKEAITEYKLIKTLKDKEGRDFSLLEISPKTGRTNQIRVHLQYLGHPIVGDDIYSPKKLVAPSGLDRMFLHAFSLEFNSISGERFLFEANPPQELEIFLSDLEENK